MFNKWVILLVVAMIVNLIGVMIDGAYLDSQGLLNHQDDTSINTIFGSADVYSADSGAGPALNFASIGAITSSLWKVVWADYSFFKPVPPETEKNFIVFWFQMLWRIINLGALLEIMIIVISLGASIVSKMLP